MNKFFIGFLAGLAAGYGLAKLAQAEHTESGRSYRVLEVRRAYSGDSAHEAALQVEIDESSPAEESEWLGADDLSMDAGTHGSGGGEP